MGWLWAGYGLRLHSYFKDKEDPYPPEGENYYSLNEFQYHKFRVVSNFNPPCPLALESMILLSKHDFNNRDVFAASGRNNLTVEERKALKELQNMPNIVIKSTDKGGAIVSNHENNTYKRASDSSLIPSSTPNKNLIPQTLTKNTINEFLTTMYQNGEIDFSIYNYLLNKECYPKSTEAKHFLHADPLSLL